MCLCVLHACARTLETVISVCMCAFSMWQMKGLHFVGQLLDFEVAGLDSDLCHCPNATKISALTAVIQLIRRTVIENSSSAIKAKPKTLAT